LNDTFDKPVFTHLEVEDYFAPISGQEFDKKHFYSHGNEYKSIFGKYANEADMYIACHFWSSSSPYILTADDLRNEKSRLKVVADVSCDVAGPIASTIKASTIADPIFGYDPKSESEVDFMNENAIAVMSVDNLPCELPMDASEDFGNELIKHIFPALFNEDPDNIIGRASETNLNGELTEYFSYLTDYVNSVAVN
jgi:alanine dehydrogenase